MPAAWERGASDARTDSLSPGRRRIRRPTAPAPESSTDGRIAAAERLLKESPGDAAAMEELAGEFLQKQRETGDGVYLEARAGAGQGHARHRSDAL